MGTQMPSLSLFRTGPHKLKDKLWGLVDTKDYFFQRNFFQPFKSCGGLLFKPPSFEAAPVLTVYVEGWTFLISFYNSQLLLPWICCSSPLIFFMVSGFKN